MDEGANSSDARKTKEIDRLVGQRVRVRRVFLGMTQEELAASLAITFQQVQKYEKGTNRISASRLFELSHALHVPVGFFFEDAVTGTVGAKSKEHGGGDESRAESLLALFSNQRAIKLIKAFDLIKDEAVQRAIVNQVRAIADFENDHEPNEET